MPSKQAAHKRLSSTPKNTANQIRKVIQSLPPVDVNFNLFGIPQEDWKKPSHNLRKQQLWERLQRYAFPGQLDRLSFSKIKISEILTALTQINFSRSVNVRWTLQQFKDNTGEAGLDTWNRRQTPIQVDDSDDEGPTALAEMKSRQCTPAQREPSADESSLGELTSSPSTPTGDSPLPSREFLPTRNQPSPDNDAPKETVAVDLGLEKEPEQRVVDRREWNQPQTIWDESCHQRIYKALSKAIRDELFRSLDRYMLAPKKYGMTLGSSINLVKHNTYPTAAVDIRFPMKEVFVHLEVGGSNPEYNPSWNYGGSRLPLYDVLGHGPLWKDNSCAIDSCIVAGMFLDAGSTQADLGGEPDDEKWLGTLSKVSRHFQKTVAFNWSCSTLESMQRRDELWDLLNEHHNGEAPVKGTWQRGNMLPAVSVWKSFTEGFGQFRYNSCRTTSECTCGAARKEATPILASDVTLDDMETGATMQQLLAHHFGPTKAPCYKCQSLEGRVRQRLVLGDLPLRLAVIPPGQTGSSKSHTGEVSFTYKTTSGIQSATYRWLGGIYYHHRHYRIYWTDRSRDDPDDGTFCVYDGKRLDGAIIGGFRGANPDERVHAAWGNEGQVLLFYERVMGPPLSLFPFPNKATSEMVRHYGGREHTSAPGRVIQSDSPSTRTGLVPADIRFASSVSMPVDKRVEKHQPQSASQRYDAVDLLVDAGRHQEVSALLAGEDRTAPETSMSPVGGGGQDHEEYECNEEFKRCRNGDMERTIELVIEYIRDQPNQQWKQHYIQAEDAPPDRADSKDPNKTTRECWICKEKVSGPASLVWPSDRLAILDPDDDWRCEMCKQKSELEVSQKPETGIEKLVHTICEKGSGGERDQMCRTLLCRSPQASVESDAGSYLRTTCANPANHHESHQETEENMQPETHGPCEINHSIQQEYQRSQSRTVENNPSTEHERKRMRDDQDEGNESAKRLKRYEEQDAKLQERRRKFDAAPELKAAMKGTYVARYQVSLPHEDDFGLGDIVEEQKRRVVAWISWLCPFSSIWDCYLAYVAALHKPDQRDKLVQTCATLRHATVRDPITQEEDISLYRACQEATKAINIRNLHFKHPGSSYKMAVEAANFGATNDWTSKANRMGELMKEKNDNVQARTSTCQEPISLED